jgi:hypothetical protein
VATVRYIGDYVNGDVPLPYLESFRWGWDALELWGSDWLKRVLARQILIEGYFLDADGDSFVRVRRSREDLGVLICRPAMSMLRTGDPAGLALSDVHDALGQITRRFAISFTPDIPAIDPLLLASLETADRERGRLKATAIELIRDKRDQVSRDHEAQIDSDLAAGLYSQALGSLMVGARNAGLRFLEAESGDLQRLRIALRAEGL